MRFLLVLLLCQTSLLEASSFLRTKNDNESRELSAAVRKQQSQSLILQEAKEVTEENLVFFEETLTKMSMLQQNMTGAPSELRDLFIVAERAANQAHQKFREVLTIYDENLNRLELSLTEAHIDNQEENDNNSLLKLSTRENRRRMKQEENEDSGRRDKGQHHSRLLYGRRHLSPQHKRFVDIQDALLGGDGEAVKKMVQDLHHHHEGKFRGRKQEKRRRTQSDQSESVWNNHRGANSVGRNVPLFNAANSDTQEGFWEEVNATGQDWEGPNEVEKLYKRDKCLQLAGCVQEMTLYDAMFFFHADDIDINTGELDEDLADSNALNRLPATLRWAKDLATEAASFPNYSPETASEFESICDNLLQIFHRIEESGGVPLWRGGTVGEVCYAQGATQYINMANVAFKSVDLADTVHMDTVSCAKELWMARPDPSDGQRFPFEKPGITYLFNEVPPVAGFPSGLEESSTNEYGQLKDNTAVVYAYGQEECGFPSSCEAHEPFSLLSMGQPLSSWCDWVCKGATNNDCGRNGTANQDLPCTAYINYLEGSNQQLEDSFVDNTLYRAAEVLAKISEKRQRGINLVFGSKASPGAVCGVKEDVVNHGKPMPGFCCLDAPHQQPTADWGSPFDCSGGQESCQNPGTFLAGFSEEACQIQGGTFCPNPADCLVLKDCVANSIIEAENSGQVAFAKYLETSPLIEDPRDPFECGCARQYFGFEPTYTNDIGICENLQTLRYVKSFAVLDDLMDDSDADSSDCDDCMDAPGPDTALPLVPFLELTDPAKNPEKSEAGPVKNGLQWRSTNFVFLQAATTLEEIFDQTNAFECFSNDPIGAGEAVCKGTKNSLITILGTIYAVANLAHRMSEFTYQLVAEVGNVEPLQVWEYTKVIYDNMDKSGSYIRDRFIEQNEAIDQIQRSTDNVNEIADSILKVVSNNGTTYRKGSKFAGCDGIDQDGLLGADDCKEDQYPPSIEFNECIPWKLPCDYEGARCIDKSFQSQADAIQFLSSVVVVSDDCAHPEDLSVEIVPVGGACDHTIFELTPKHTCGDEGFEGPSNRVVVGVDEATPDVKCGFDKTSRSWNKLLYADGNYLIVKELPDSDLTELPFYYDVVDNCADSVAVDVAVSSNVLTKEDSIVMARRMSTDDDSSDTAMMAISPKTCTSTKGWCIQSADIRYYRFSVTATDKAGNVGKAECFVGVEPMNKKLPFPYFIQELKKTVSYSSQQPYALGSLRLSSAANGASTFGPSDHPSDVPSSVPSEYQSEGSLEPLTFAQSDYPSDFPSDTPSIVPTFPPSANPSDYPSDMPTFPPSDSPSDVPSTVPTFAPSDNPSDVPSTVPSAVPSTSPIGILVDVNRIITPAPSNSPSDVPSALPSDSPSSILPASKAEPLNTDPPKELCPSRRFDEVNDYTFVAFNLPERPSGETLSFPSGRYAAIQDASACFRIMFFGLEFICDPTSLQWVMDRGFLFTGADTGINNRCTNMTSLDYEYFEHGLTSSLPP